jgi:hypothetical protein
MTKVLAMKKIYLALPLMIFLGSTAHSQEQPPQLLIRAAHCLAAKNFLPSSSAASLTFGYLVDQKSYPGEKVIYLVDYAGPARSNGLVFAVFLTEKGRHQTFNIQNNAGFVLSRHEFTGESFVDPPLGGTWTREHLASAIKRIEKQPRFTIPVKELFAADPSTSCESYTDR